MAEIQSFLALLDTTVKAPRLSGSKVQQLTEQSQNLLAHDTAIVSSFLRLNNSLPPESQARISSLYIFDAIARAARSGIGKTGGGGGGKEREKMGLLMKMEGVVESWVGGMVDDGKGGVWAEGREKTRKIVEIWTKSATFPPACLERLSARIAGTEIRSVTPNYDPPAPIMSPALPEAGTSRGVMAAPALGSGQAPAISASAPGQLPPDILKLLGISTQPQIGTTTPNGSVPPPANAELASILATIKPAVPAQSAPGPSQLNQPIPARPATIAGLSIDPNQLATLTALAAQVGAPPPPTLPPPLSHPLDTRRHFDNFEYQGAGVGKDQHGSPPQQVRYNSGIGPGPGPGSSERRWGGERERSRSRSPPFGQYGGERWNGERERERGGGRGGKGRGGGGGGRRFDDRDVAYEWDRERERDRPRFDDRQEDRSFGGKGGYRGGDEYNRGGDGYSRGGDDYNRGGEDYRRGRGGDDYPRGGYGREDRDDGYARRARGRGRGRGGGGSHGGRESFDGGQGSFDGGRGRFGGSPNHAPHPLPAPPIPIPPLANNAPVPAPMGRAPPPIQPGKDEFGRDLPDSNTSANAGGDDEEDMALDDDSDEDKAGGAKTAVVSLPPPPAQYPPFSVQQQQDPAQSFEPTPFQQPPFAPQAQFQPPPQQSVPFQQQPTPFQQTTPFHQPTPPTQQLNLQSFDLSSFDPTNPSSWMSLAEAWKTSMGRDPGQMDLMEFLASGGNVAGSGNMGGDGADGDGEQWRRGHAAGTGVWRCGI